MGRSFSNMKSREVLERRETYRAAPFLSLAVERVRLPDGWWWWMITGHPQ